MIGLIKANAEKNKERFALKADAKKVQRVADRVKQLPKDKFVNAFRKTIESFQSEPTNRQFVFHFSSLHLFFRLEGKRAGGALH